MDLLEDDEVLRVGDRLIYQVTEEREPEVLLFVNAQGMVSVPLIGTMEAAGKTPRALAYEIKEALEVDFFYRATVLINPTVERSRGTIRVVGVVMRQGMQELPSDDILTLSNAILRAGGLGNSSLGEEVVLIRPADPDVPGSVEERTTVDVATMLMEGDFSGDIALQDGDLIVVPERNLTTDQIIMQGLVVREGLVDLPRTGGLTVSRAILQAGGFRQFARDNRVILIRADETLSEEERRLEVDVKAILEGDTTEEDPVLQPGDIVTVEERFISFGD